MKFQHLLTPCFCYDKNFVDPVVSKESGFDRVKKMYQLNEFNLMSPEMFFFIQNATYTVAISAVFGGLASVGKAREDFFRKNAAKTYESEHLARRNLVDTMSLSMIKGGLRSALKYGSFSSAYILSTMTVANYNNKITVWEHIATGALLGSIFRINFGLKGMAVSAALGGFLGIFAGGILVLAMKLGNVTIDDLRALQAEKYYSLKRRQNKNISLDDM